MALTVGELVAYLRADDRDWNGPLNRAKRTLNDVANDASRMGSRFDSAAGMALRAASGIAKIGGAVGAIGAVKGAVVALAGSIGVIPGIAAAAAAAIATIKIGTSGLGKAISGLGKTSGGGGGGGGGGAEKAISDARRIADAERGVARAQEQVKFAQEALTRARERASKAIEDMQYRLQDAALDEEGAVLALERARERLANVKASDQGQGLDLKEAELGVKQAEQALANTRREYKDLAAEADKANKAGVEGSDEVISAQRGLQDAMRGVEDAQRSLAEAHEDAARGAAAAGGGAGAVNEAFEKLSPNAKAVALAIHGLRDEWLGLTQSVQDALFAGIADDINLLAGKYLPVAKTGFTGIATEINRGTRETAAYLAESRQVKDVASIFGNVKTAIGNTADTAKPLTSIMLDILTVSSEFLPQLTGGWGGAAARAADFIRTARETGQLKNWIQEGLNTLAQLWQLLKNIAEIVGTVWDAFEVEGAGSLQTMINLTARIKEFLKSAEGQQALKALAAIMHTVSSVAGDVLMEALKSLAKVIVQLSPGIQEMAKIWGGMLVSALRTLTPMLMSIATWISQNADTLATLIPILYAGVKAFEAVNAIMKIFNMIAAMNPWTLLIAATIVLVTLIVTYWDQIVAALKAAWDWIVRTATEVWDWIVEKVKQAVQFIVDIFLNWTLPGLIIKHWETIKQAVANAGQWIIDKVTAAWDWVKRNIIDNITQAAQWVGRKIDEIIDWFKNLPSKIGNAVKDAANWLVRTGEDMIAGLLRGLGNMAHKIWEWIKGMASRIWDEITSIFDIGSPSRKFEWIGQMLGEGLVRGLDGMTGDVSGAAAAMADAATMDIPAPQVGPIGAGTAGGPTGAATGSGANGGKPVLYAYVDGSAYGRLMLEALRESIRDQGGDPILVLSASG